MPDSGWHDQGQDSGRDSHDLQHQERLFTRGRRGGAQGEPMGFWMMRESGRDRWSKPTSFLLYVVAFLSLWMISVDDDFVSSLLFSFWISWLLRTKCWIYAFHVLKSEVGLPCKYLDLVPFLSRHTHIVSLLSLFTAHFVTWPIRLFFSGWIHQKIIICPASLP